MLINDNSRRNEVENTFDPQYTPEGPATAVRSESTASRDELGRPPESTVTRMARDTSRKDERRLVACTQCERTYPGFRRQDGTIHVVGGPTCPNCDSSSFAEVTFDPSVTLPCPNCGTEHREVIDSTRGTTDVTATGHDPDGIVEVTCAECGAEFDVGYEAVR